MNYTSKGAVLSDDRAFRYHLWRSWSGVDLFTPVSMIFIMLNPSTADGREDDPTIKRCVGFARSYGCERLDVVNLFAYRATKPEDLKRSVKASGLVGDPENDGFIMRLLADRPSAVVVAAWGEHGRMLGRDAEMLALLKLARRQPFALRISESGMPSHPLYIPANADLVPYG